MGQVDIKKVNLDVIKTWIAKEVNSILGFDDDVLIDMIFNMLSLDEVGETAESDTVGGGSEAHSSHTGSLFGGERGALHREVVVAASVCAER